MSVIYFAVISRMNYLPIGGGPYVILMNRPATSSLEGRPLRYLYCTG